MRYVLALIVTLCSTAYAATLAEQVSAIQGAQGVIAAELLEEVAPVAGFASLSTAQVAYYYVSGDVAEENTVGLLVLNYGAQGEAAYWSRRLPSPLAVAAPIQYMTSRNTPFTAAQIESYCNQLWVAANPTAGPILEFNVQVVNGKTVKISGKFDVGSSSRSERSYYIWLVDPNGAVTPGNANVKFERIQ